MDRKILYYQYVSSSKIVLQTKKNQIKTPESYFLDFKKLILKFIWRSKRSKIVNTILKKNKAEGVAPQFQDLLQSHIVKTLW